MKTYFTLIICFFLVQINYAADFYCDPLHGNSANKGTKDNPWGTLQSVFEKGIQFATGDKIFLLSGNHGHVKITGVNEKYINIIGVKGEIPVVNSIVCGTDAVAAARWTISNIIFKGNKDAVVASIHQNSSKIRFVENVFKADNASELAIDVMGSQCKIENNRISNFKNGVKISGQKNQIRSNSITFFSNNAIEISGDSNLLEYNLIKESIAADAIVNTGILFFGKEIIGNVLRGNTIINFVNATRNQLGLLNGIYSQKNSISESVFENNVIVTNGENGIYLEGVLNNLKLANNTVVNPYFGISFDENNTSNSLLAIKIIGEADSSNLIIKNNLSNDVLFENIKGIADHNLTIPVSVHDFDSCFKNWALFDFSLHKDSKALNAGSSEMAPKLDASLNKRSLGNFVNIGAFEYTKIDESNEIVTITSEITDRQIHSRGKSDWDGQPEIRIGGVAEKIDGAAVFSFKLPIIPGGKKIISARFKVYLSKIDNAPEGGIDLYGLPPKTNYWVTEDMFYQGTFGQDLLARPIQNNFVDSSTYTGTVEMSDAGKKELANYLNTLLEAGSKPGEYVFLRMNPNNKDVADFNRWNFVSANNEEKKNHPMLEVTLGYPELNQGIDTTIEPIKNTLIVAPNPLENGAVNFYFLGFDKPTQVDLKIINFSGEQVFKNTMDVSSLKEAVFYAKNLNLPAGKYMVETTIDTEVKKQLFFVW